MVKSDGRKANSQTSRDGPARPAPCSKDTTGPPTYQRACRSGGTPKRAPAMSDRLHGRAPEVPPECFGSNPCPSTTAAATSTSLRLVAREWSRSSWKAAPSSTE